MQDFASESSAGSEKAKKLGLISAGFGRYRTKKDGPVTHKIVEGKLVKRQSSGPKGKESWAEEKAKTGKEKLETNSKVVAMELDWADCDSPKDVHAAVKEINGIAKTSVKVAGKIYTNPNNMYSAKVEGTRLDLKKFLKVYTGNDRSDSELEDWMDNSAK